MSSPAAALASPFTKFIWSKTVRTAKTSLRSDCLSAFGRADTDSLAHVWNSEEAMQGMTVVGEKWKPGLYQFRKRYNPASEDHVERVNQFYETELKQMAHGMSPAHCTRTAIA